MQPLNDEEIGRLAALKNDLLDKYGPRYSGRQGDYDSLGVMAGREMNLVGPSNTGLADPGQHTCISLAQVVTTLLTYKPKDPLNLIAVRALGLLSDEACDAFAGVQREIEEEENQKGRG